MEANLFANHRLVLLTILAILAVRVSIAASSPSSTAVFSGDFFSDVVVGGGGGELFTVGDDEAEEFQMDSEINRRILATRRYISYGALRRNSIPCSRRGASYYNCQRGAQANPYSRGCSAITRCRR